MSVLNTLEKRFGRFAIPGLIRYVVALNALVFLLNLVSPSYVYVLSLDPAAIAAGQVWRLVTWIFIPTTMSLLWIIFYLMFTWWMGDLLESTWGAFRLNLYYLVGYLGGTAAAMLFGASFGNIALNASLLFAIGTLAPNLEILLFGILPLRLKWVALISAALFVIEAVTSDWGTRAAILIAFGNYLLFFCPPFLRNAAERRENAIRRSKFKVMSYTPETLHKCEVCGRTEVSNPDLDFRVSSDGHEYCTAHLPGRPR